MSIYKAHSLYCVVKAPVHCHRVLLNVILKWLFKAHASGAKKTIQNWNEQGEKASPKSKFATAMSSNESSVLSSNFLRIFKQCDLKSFSTSKEREVSPEWKSKILIPRCAVWGWPALPPASANFQRPNRLPARKTSQLRSTLGLQCAELALHLRVPEAAQGAVSKQPFLWGVRHPGSSDQPPAQQDTPRHSPTHYL